MASEIWSQILSVHLVSKLLLGARFCKSTYQSGLRRRTRRWRGRCRSWCGEKVQGLQRERREVFFLQWWVLKGPKLNKFFHLPRETWNCQSSLRSGSMATSPPSPVWSVAFFCCCPVVLHPYPPNACAWRNAFLPFEPRLNMRIWKSHFPFPSILPSFPFFHSSFIVVASLPEIVPRMAELSAAARDNQT